MAQIIVNPEEVDSVSSQFATKRGEMESMVNQAKSMMNNLMGQWKGNLANKTAGDWSSLQPNLTNAIQTLQHASEILKAAAAAFRSADGS